MRISNILEAPFFHILLRNIILTYTKNEEEAENGRENRENKILAQTHHKSILQGKFFYNMTLPCIRDAFKFLDYALP